jgi:hypothetical protein
LLLVCNLANRRRSAVTVTVKDQLRRKSRGVKSRFGERIKLQHIRIGGRILTTEKDMLDFFVQLAESDAAYFDREPESIPLRPKRRSESARRAAIEKAMRELPECGI